MILYDLNVVKVLPLHCVRLTAFVKKCMFAKYTLYDELSVSMILFITAVCSSGLTE